MVRRVSGDLAYRNAAQLKRLFIKSTVCPLTKWIKHAPSRHNRLN